MTDDEKIISISVTELELEVLDLALGNCVECRYMMTKDALAELRAKLDAAIDHEGGS